MKEGKLLLKVVSPTGCVHLVSDVDRKYYRTECNHKDYFKGWDGGYYHDWRLTEKPVTCKRCLKSLGPAEEQKPETKLRTLTVQSGGFGAKSRTVQIMSGLKKDGCTVDDIITITSYHSGPYNDYTVWYKKGAK